MKMIQALYPCNQDWQEIFYDGELRVSNNIVEIPKGKEHWALVLEVERGFIAYEEPVTSQAQTPRKRVTKETSHD